MRPVSRREALRMLAASVAFVAGGGRLAQAAEKSLAILGGPEQQGERLVSLQEAIVKSYTKVRTEPTTKSAEVTLLEPGQRILVKPSATAGWWEVVVTTGIGSNRYVRPVGFPQYIENRAIKMIGEMQLIPFDGRQYDASALLNPDLVPTEDLQRQIEGSSSPEVKDLVMGPEQLLGMNVTIDYSLAPLYVQAIRAEQGQLHLIKPEQYPLAVGESQKTKLVPNQEKLKWEALVQAIKLMRDTQKMTAVWTPEGVKSVPPPSSVRVVVTDWDDDKALQQGGFNGGWDALRVQYPDLIIKFANDIIGVKMMQDGQMVMVVRVAINSDQISYKFMLKEAITAWTNATPYQAETMIYPRR